MSELSYEQEYGKKYSGITACPTCGESRVGKINEKRKAF